MLDIYTQESKKTTSFTTAIMKFALNFMNWELFTAPRCGAVGVWVYWKTGVFMKFLPGRGVTYHIQPLPPSIFFFFFSKKKYKKRRRLGRFKKLLRPKLTMTTWKPRAKNKDVERCKGDKNSRERICRNGFCEKILTDNRQKMSEGTRKNERNKCI